MQLNLNPVPGQNFSFSASLPPGFEGYVLRGGHVLTAIDPEAGSIVQQELSNSHYTIRLYLFDLLQPGRLKVFQPGSFLCSILAVKNNLDYRIEGLKTLRLKHGQFALLRSSGRPAILYLSNNRPHEFMEISWTAEWLKQLIPRFDFLRSLFTPAGANKSFFLRPHPRPAGAMALDTVQHILKSPFDEDISRLLFECHTREYLILILVEAAKEANEQMRLTDRERQILIAIGEEVKTNHSKKFRMADLYRKAGMSATRFKNAIKEILGTTLGKHSMTARMEEARRLLLEGELSPKQISEKVSYKDPTSFNKQFKKHFGYPPGEVQQNKQHR